MIQKLLALIFISTEIYTVAYYIRSDFLPFSITARFGYYQQIAYRFIKDQNIDQVSMKNEIIINRQIHGTYSQTLAFPCFL